MSIERSTDVGVLTFGVRASAGVGRRGKSDLAGPRQRPRNRPNVKLASSCFGQEVQGCAGGTLARMWLGRVALLLVLSIAGISIVGIAPGGSAAGGGLVAEGRAYSVVVVQAGDSLWSVAQRAKPTEDPRVVIERIQELNGLSNALLQPGQTLRVE